MTRRINRGRNARPDGADGGSASWRDGLPVITAGRVTLREPQRADAPALVEGLSNATVGRFMTPPPQSVESFERFIVWIQGERRAGRCLCFAMVPAGEERAAGLIQMRALDPSFGVAEWGFALEPRYWGTGLFMESAGIAVDFAFRNVRVHRLEARASVANERGNGVLRKLGATPEGTLRQSLEHASQRVDQFLWAMLADEWLNKATPPSYQVRWVPTPPELAQGPAPARKASRPGWCEVLPALQGRLGRLRELAVEDGPELQRMLSDPAVRRYGVAPPQDPNAFARFIQWSGEQRLLGRYACFGIVPAAGVSPVGLIQLRSLEPSFRTAEWGFALGRPYWGTGLFPEAARLVLDFAFSTVGVCRLEARTPVANERAIRALRRLGAVFEGALRQSFLLGGQYRDDALYALLAADWHAAATSHRSIA